MKNRNGKLLSLLLILVLILAAGLLPQGQAAYAANGIPDASVVFVSDHSFYNPSKLYYTNGASDTGSLADNPNWNVHYDPATGVLELKDYNGTGVTIGGATQVDTTIRLIGNNTINGSITNINSGNITITAANNATLTVNASSSTSSAIGISAGYGSAGYAGSVAIKGKANVIVNATATSTDYNNAAFGIYAHDEISILEEASYSATCKSATQSTGTLAGGGMYAQKGVVLNTDGTVYIDASQVGVYSYGITVMSSGSQMTKVRRMDIKWKKDGMYGVPIYPQNIFDSVADNYAININTTDAVASYRYGTPYTVNVSNGQCDARGDNTGQYLANDTVTITANTLPSGLAFKEWTSGDVSFANAKSSTTTFTMPSKEVNVKADYNAFTVQPGFAAADATKGVISFTMAAETTEAPKLVTIDGDESNVVGGQYFYGSGTSRTATIYNGTGTYQVPAGEYRVAARFDGCWFFSDPFEVSYTQSDTTYDIHVNNGKATPASAKAGETVTLTADPAPSGKVFLKWRVEMGSIAFADEEAATTTFVMPAEYVAVTATYTDAGSTAYTVAFDAGGGSGTMPSINVLPGHTFDLPENGFTAPAGKEFDKWEIPNYGKFSPGTAFQPPSDITVKALWKDKASANPFVDVASGDYFYDPVMWAVAHDPQITNGTEPTHFSPGATCTRAQIVTFLWRAKGCPEPSSATNPFSDVKESDYYYKAVLWAVEQGVTSGMDATHFGPAGNCTRAQAVTFLWRAEGQPSVSGSNPFSDVASGDYYYDAVLWAVQKDVTKGTDATHFSPATACTRGQIVTFLFRSVG